MPVIRHSQVAIDESLATVKRRILADAGLGAISLNVSELYIAPGGGVAMHLHPTHEEGMLVLDGPLDYVLGDGTGQANSGDLILAPKGVKHQLSNPGPEPRRLVAIHPVTEIDRLFL